LALCTETQVSVSQNLLARSLHEAAYHHNPGFNRFIEETGLPWNDVNVEVLFADLLVVVVGTRNRCAKRRKIDLAELITSAGFCRRPASGDASV
jgi:hypothetical protein